MKAIAILNLKGGVGKTVTAVNMAHILAADHKQRVLLVDCDSQCNATEFFGVRPGMGTVTLADILRGDFEPYVSELVAGTDYPGVDVIPGSDELMDMDMSKITSQRVNGRVLADLCFTIGEDDEYDYVLFDCPPAFNAASAAALLAADEVIIPIKLDAFLSVGWPMSAARSTTCSVSTQRSALPGRSSRCGATYPSCWRPRAVSATAACCRYFRRSFAALTRSTR